MNSRQKRKPLIPRLPCSLTEDQMYWLQWKLYLQGIPSGYNSKEPELKLSTVPITKTFYKW